MLTEPREALPRSSTYTVTPSQPARIDLTTIFEDRPPPLHTKGIYSIQGDALTYCVASPDQPRPSEFATRKGDGHTLAVLKRVRHESRESGVGVALRNDADPRQWVPLRPAHGQPAK